LIRALRLFQLNLLSFISLSIILFTILKSLTESFRKINENLQKHLENLDALEKSKLPSNLVRKCKDFSKLLLETTAKVDKVLNKLDE
jgi:Skp family chaperone for outer membrane proteins